MPMEAQSSAAIVDSALIWWVNAIAAGLWVALFVAVVAWAILALRKAPRQALLPAGLYLVCLAIRIACADRLPMISAHGDFTHLRDITIWMQEGLQRYVGVSTPSGARMLHWLAFKLLGPSVDLAFGLGLAAGAATVVPVYLVARTLTGSWFGGLLAGLAYCAYPPAISFTNGLALESTSALLLTLAFAAFLSNMRQRSHAAAAVYCVSMLLFVQSRGEGLILGALAVAVQLALAWDQAKLKTLAAQWWWAAAALAVAIPYVLSLVTFSESELVAEFAQEASWRLGLALAIGASALVLARLAQKGRIANLASLTTWTLLVLAFASLVFLRILGHYGQGDFWFSTPKTLPEYPFIYFYGIHPYADLGFLIAPGVFPFYFFVFAALGLLPVRQGLRWVPNLPALLLLLLPITADQLLSTRATGQVIAEGFRYHIPQSGLLAISVGLGGWWVWQLVAQRKMTGQLVGALVGALMLMPLVTHNAFITDTDFNIQEEYRFIRNNMDKFPERGLLVVPDFQVDYRWERVERVDITERFRVDHLLFGMAAMNRKTVMVLHLQRDRERLARLKRDVLVYLGQDCYRVNAPLEIHPWCQLVAHQEGSTRVASATIPDRRFCGGGMDVLGPWVPTLQLGLYQVSPEAMRSILQAIPPMPSAK